MKRLAHIETDSGEEFEEEVELSKKGTSWLWRGEIYERSKYLRQPNREDSNKWIIVRLIG